MKKLAGELGVEGLYFLLLELHDYVKRLEQRMSTCEEFLRKQENSRLEKTIMGKQISKECALKRTEKVGLEWPDPLK